MKLQRPFYMYKHMLRKQQKHTISYSNDITNLLFLVHMPSSTFSMFDPYLNKYKYFALSSLFYSTIWRNSVLLTTYLPHNIAMLDTEVLTYEICKTSNIFEMLCMYL